MTKKSVDYDRRNRNLEKLVKSKGVLRLSYDQTKDNEAMTGISPSKSDMLIQNSVNHQVEGSSLGATP